MGEWLEELKNMGKTIVIVSHDVEFCALFAEKEWQLQQPV